MRKTKREKGTKTNHAKGMAKEEERKDGGTVLSSYFPGSESEQDERSVPLSSLMFTEYSSQPDSGSGLGITKVFHFAPINGLRHPYRI